MLNGVDHLPHTHDLARNAFSRGQPLHGAELADYLERIVALHDPSTIAAVIIEPLAGSTGVLVPPIGYLQKIRDICTKYGILLIFDEVISGFGRLGAPFATDRFGIVPDILTLAKGITNATVPMGATVASTQVHDAFMQGPPGAIEFFHGYTYSSHVLACAASIATLDTYRDEGLFERAAELSPYFEEAAHRLAGLPNVIDIRNLGLVAGIELASRPGAVGARAYEIFVKCYETGVLVRATADILAISPPLIISRAQIDEIFGKLRDAISSVA
jgi:beta-alanine--pyruvate transaminase